MTKLRSIKEKADLQNGKPLKLSNVMCHAEIIEKCVFYPLLVKWRKLNRRKVSNYITY